MNRDPAGLILQAIHKLADAHFCTGTRAHGLHLEAARKLLVQAHAKVLELQHAQDHKAA